jgi:hypothetical protein
MPFQDFAPFFGPDELETMTAAYNAAWYQLWLAGIAVTLHPDAVRKKLAQVILAAACTGKREQKRLEAIAIKALSHQSRLSGGGRERRTEASALATRIKGPV